MFSKKKGAGKKRSGIGKFFKTKKALTLSLGVCLAVVASAYVATAKFSADSITGKWEATKKTVTYTTQVVDGKGKGIEGLEVTYQEDHLLKPGETSHSSGNVIAIGKTDKDGKAKGKYSVCSNGKQSMACYVDTNSHTTGNSYAMIGKIKITVSKGEKKVSTNRYFIGKTVKDSTIKIIIKNTEKAATKVAKSAKYSGTWKSTDKGTVYSIQVVDANNKPLEGYEVHGKSAEDQLPGDTKSYDQSDYTIGKTNKDGKVTDSVATCTDGKKTIACYTKLNKWYLIGRLYITVYKDGKKQTTVKDRYFPGTTVKNGKMVIQLKDVNKKATAKVAEIKSKLTETFSRTNLTTSKPTYSVTVPKNKIPKDNNITLVIERKQCFEKGTAGHPDGGCLDYKTPSKRYRLVTTQLVNGKYTASFGTINIPMKNSLGVTVKRIFWYDAGDTTTIVKSLRVVDPSDKATMDLLQSTREVSAKDVDSQISKKLLVPMKKAPNY